jgi:hypothetical protein
MNRLKRDRRFRLDRDTAERILGGLAADDAPPDYAAVAALLVATTADDGSPAPGEQAALRAYRNMVHARATARARRRVHPWRTAAGRVAVFATASTLAIGGGVAAAATGSLPAPAQRVAHTILGGLGVPAVPSQAGPGDFVRTDTSVATMPETTEAPPPTSTDVPADPVVAVENATPEATPAVTTTAPVATRNGNGAAAPSVARSTEPGPEHGAAVCFVVTDDVCLAGPRSGPKDDRAGEDRTGPGAAKGHRNGDGVADSAKGHRHDRGAADPARGDKKGNGAATGPRADKKGSAGQGQRGSDSAADGSRNGHAGKDFGRGHGQKSNTGKDTRGSQNGTGAVGWGHSGR